MGVGIVGGEKQKETETKRWIERKAETEREIKGETQRDIEGREGQRQAFRI